MIVWLIAAILLVQALTEAVSDNPRAAVVLAGVGVLTPAIYHFG